MEGDLVRLERVTEEDYERLARWAASAAGVYNQGGASLYTTAAVRAALESGAHYLMVVTNDGRRIGAMNWSTLAYEGSYLAGGGLGEEELWAKGYGAEAMLLLLDYLFHAKNAHRVQMVTGLYNARMMRIVTQGYLVVEGVMRDYFFLDGEYHHAIVCSLLRDEYYALAASGELGSGRDVVPREEKEEAVRLFREFAERQPGNYLGALLEPRRSGGGGR